MRHSAYKLLFLIFIVTLGLFSCKNNMPHFSTEIINPEYKSYVQKEERGYHVSFQVSNEENVPVAVILNNIKMPIDSSSKEGLTYRVNVIATSRLIRNYQAERSDKENGIILDKNGKEYFIPITFERK